MDTTTSPGQGQGSVPTDHRITQLEACVDGLSKDMAVLRQQSADVLGKISEIAQSYKELAAFASLTTADRAAKDERWRNHEKEHEEIKDDLKSLKEKVQENTISIAKFLGAGGVGGGIAALIAWLLQNR